MLEEILDHLHNYFEVSINRGGFTVSSGTLDVPFLVDGQYFRICGSILNDGVYQYPCYELQDETFIGEIWGLAVPRAVLDLAQEIDTWQDEHPLTDKVSESFGGYSYSRATNSGVGGAPIGWPQVFAPKLNRWRKMS